jgi:hypothetical protein
VGDVYSLDILVWENFQHIAILDAFAAGDPETVKVCQSTAGGPQATWHKLVANKAQNGLFTLSPASKVGGQFYVVTLDLLPAQPMGPGCALPVTEL